MGITRIALNEAREKVGAWPWRKGEWRHHRAAVVTRLVLDRICANASVGDQFERALVGRPVAPGVHAIGQGDNGFTPFYRSQLLVDCDVDRVIETGQVTALDRADCALEFAAVTREISEEVHLFVEGNNHHPVVRLELLDEI